MRSGAERVYNKHDGGVRGHGWVDGWMGSLIHKEALGTRRAEDSTE